MPAASEPSRVRIPLPVSEHKPAPYQGPRREELLALRREFLNPGIVTYYKEPICIVEGHMQYLWDETGKQYLDAIAGIVTVSVGHCHPKITARVQEQVARLVHTTTIYLHPNVTLLARELAARMPKGSGLKVSYFTSSGSEANDLAILMARLHTGRHDVLAVRNGYHGGAQMPMGLTAVGTWKYPIASPSGVKHVAPGYCYRCPFGLTYPSCDLKCARSVEDTIRYETSGEIAAFIGEPIQGVGGTVCPPPEYFGIVYEIVRRYGGLCIADEVQTGFGRTGAHYWGFQNWGVVPDMVTMAKGIGNGAPLGAVTTKPEIAAHMAKRLHFNTFGGNPVSALQGLATLEIIDEERIQQRAAEIGAYLKGKLLELQEKHVLIGEVRGLGLMLGVELVKDRTSKAPAGAECAAVVEMAKDRGLLLGKGGLYGNVIRIKPPMCLTKADCDFLADCLDEGLEAAGR
jgi:alanine-glyoxylate transaminase/(R)-3-amino-2-methylpropionate-pyruvate transaminase